MIAFWSRLRAFALRLSRSASWDRALDDELQAYLDHQIDARISAGMSPAEARRTALADMGGVEQVKEQVRSATTGAWFDTFRQDLRYAFRALQHSRGFTTWVIGSLAIGMAVTIAALALLNATLFLPFPEVTDQKRLVRVSMSRNCGRPDCWTRMSAPAHYDALRERLTGVQGLAAYTAGEIAFGLPDARSLQAVLASGNYFEVLGVRPLWAVPSAPARHEGRPPQPSSPTACGRASSAPIRQRLDGRYASPISSFTSSAWRPRIFPASIGAGPRVRGGWRLAAALKSGFRCGWRTVSCRSRQPSSVDRNAICTSSDG